MTLSITDKSQNGLDQRITFITNRVCLNHNGRHLRFVPVQTCKHALLIQNGSEVLRDAGRISAEVARALALLEYEKYNAARIKREVGEQGDDFDSVVKQIKTKNDNNRGTK